MDGNPSSPFQRKKVMSDGPKGRSGGQSEETHGSNSQTKMTEKGSNEGTNGTFARGALTGGAKAGLRLAVISPGKFKKYLKSKQSLDQKIADYNSQAIAFRKELQSNSLSIAHTTRQNMKRFDADLSIEFREIEFQPDDYQTKYEFKSEDSEFLIELQDVYDIIHSHNPQDELESMVRVVGLAAVESSDIAYSNQDYETADVQLNIAQEMADIFLGMDPYSGVVRDVLEFYSGLNIVTGRSLSEGERTFSGVAAICSLFTFGIASSVKNIANGIFKVGKRIFRSNKYNKIISRGGNVGSDIAPDRVVKIAENIIDSAGKLNLDIAKIVPRIARNGDKAVKITMKNGNVIDINKRRVKEYVPNTHSMKTKGIMNKVKFKNSIPGSKGFKRAPTPEELKILEEI